MEDTFGDRLRALRRSRGMSIRALARAANCSPATVGHVETGIRPATPEMAAAWDRALGTSPLLVSRLDADDATDDDEAVKRRVLAGYLAAVSGLGATTGPDGIAEAVRSALMAADTAGDDWLAVVAKHYEKMAAAPGPMLEIRILADLVLAGQGMRRGDEEAAGAAVHLAVLQGQCRSDRGDLAGASTWYDTAVALADRCADRRLAVYVQGRRACRLIYEAPPGAVYESAGRGLAVDARPSVGAMECLVATGAVQARLGDLRARETMNVYTDMAARMKDDPLTATYPVKRALYSRTYVLSRIGSLAELQAAHDEAEAGDLPPTRRAHAGLNLAYGIVAAGDVSEGVRHAAAVLASVPRPHRTRILSDLVDELVAAIPRHRRGRDDAVALRSMARR